MKPERTQIIRINSYITPLQAVLSVRIKLRHWRQTRPKASKEGMARKQDKMKQITSLGRFETTVLDLTFNCLACSLVSGEE
jgi:hypothetical protein